MSNKIYKIYTLSNVNKPEEIRYIGITKMSLKGRLSCHVCLAKTEPYNHRTNWVNKNKNKILIQEIDSSNDLKKCLELEMHYIKLFKSFGAKLINSTNGG